MFETHKAGAQNTNTQCIAGIQQDLYIRAPKTSPMGCLVVFEGGLEVESIMAPSTDSVSFPLLNMVLDQ